MSLQRELCDGRWQLLLGLQSVWLAARHADDLFQEGEGLVDVHGLLGNAAFSPCLGVPLTASQVHQIQLPSKRCPFCTSISGVQTSVSSALTS